MLKVYDDCLNKTKGVRTTKKVGKPWFKGFNKQLETTNLIASLLKIFNGRQ